MYKKSVNSDIKGGHCPQPINTNPSDTKECEPGCRHRCCEELRDKILENRLRMLEIQTMQNMHINNAMHIQLISQMRPVGPVYPTGAPFTNPMNPYGAHSYSQNSLFGIPPTNQMHVPNYAQTPLLGNQFTHAPYPGGIRVQAPSIPVGHYFPMGQHLSVHQQQGQQIHAPVYPNQFQSHLSTFPAQQPSLVRPVPMTGNSQINVPSLSNQQQDPQKLRYYYEQSAMTHNQNSTNPQKKDTEPPIVQHKPIQVKDLEQKLLNTPLHIKKDNTQRLTSRVNSSRKRQNANFRTDDLTIEGKKWCVKPTPPELKNQCVNKIRTQTVSVEREPGDSSLANSNIQDSEASNEPIYINESPQKLENENKDTDHFLEIPPVKYNLQELIQDISPQEQRD